MRSRTYAAIVLGMGVVATACQAPSPTPSAIASAQPSIAGSAAQVLRLSLGGEPLQLDPVHSTGGPVLLSITRSLTYVDEHLRTVPGLADRWALSEGGTRITFHLGTHSYSNGEPIVADDFVYSWRKAVDPRVKAEMAYLLEPVVGFAAAQAANPQDNAAVDAALAGLGVAAPDPRTFVVNLSRPASSVLAIAGLPFLAPEKATFTYGEASGYVSSGPMTLSQWTHGSRMVLVPNPHWNTENPSDLVSIDEIDVAFLDPAGGLAAYRADGLDALDLSPADAVAAMADATLSGEVARGGTYGLAALGFDLKDPNRPFGKSRLLRRAFTEALDTGALLAAVFSGLGTVASGTVPPGVPGHVQGQLVTYDRIQALTDFDQALAALGMTPADLHLELGYGVFGENEAAAAFAQAQWKDAFGIDVALTPFPDLAAYNARLATDPLDISLLRLPVGYNHPSSFLDPLVACNAHQLGYCNPEVDALLGAAAANGKLDEEVAIYTQVQEMVAADAPFTTATFLQRVGLIKPWVQGLAITGLDSSLGEHFLYRVTIAAH